MSNTNSESAPTKSPLPGTYACTVFGSPLVGSTRGQLHSLAQAALDACTDPEARPGHTYRFAVKKNGAARTDLVLVKAVKPSLRSSSVDRGSVRA